MYGVTLKLRSNQPAEGLDPNLALLGEEGGEVVVLIYNEQDPLGIAVADNNDHPRNIHRGTLLNRGPIRSAKGKNI